MQEMLVAMVFMWRLFWCTKRVEMTSGHSAEHCSQLGLKKKGTTCIHVTYAKQDMHIACPSQPASSRCHAVSHKAVKVVRGGFGKKGGGVGLLQPI